MRITYHSFMMILILSVQFVGADDVFTMDDINASLLMEYQSQLVLQSQEKHKVQTKKSPARRQAQVQRRVAPSPVKQPVAGDLFEAAADGNVNLITRLLRQGIDVNTANSERETALHMAAANGRYPAVIYLINHGANINARTVKNWLPIHHATRFRKPNIANYLMNKGASSHIRTSDGLSAIDMARALKDQQLLRILGAK